MIPGKTRTYEKFPIKQAKINKLPRILAKLTKAGTFSITKVEQMFLVFRKN